MIIDVKSSKLTWSARAPQTATSENIFHTNVYGYLMFHDKKMCQKGINKLNVYLK